MYSNNLLTSGKTPHDPFGMLLEGRNWEGGSEYRFGFNGKESDKETYGDCNIYDYGFRIYNPRLGKFLSVDPLSKTFPWYTPYQFAGNKPIWAIDLDGLEEKGTNDDLFDPNNPNDKVMQEGDRLYNEGEKLFNAAQTTEEIIAVVKSVLTDMIELAESVDFNIAARHLKHYLNGGGSYQKTDWAEIEKYTVLQDAIAVNEDRLRYGVVGYQDDILYSSEIGWQEASDNLKDGETYTYYTATWQRVVHFPEGTDAKFGFGSATLKTSAVITVSRVGDVVEITGSIQHILSDYYDWDQGKSTGFLNRFVPDSYMGFLEREGETEYFPMGAKTIVPLFVKSWGIQNK